MAGCLFCGIAARAIPSHVVWEDDTHLALLDIFPSVRGQTLVVPKNHAGSYVFALSEDAYASLMLAARRVGLLIDARLGSIRTCAVLEGMEVDHAHVKLYPIYEVGRAVAAETIDLNVYPGYLSTLHGPRAADAELATTAARLRGDTPGR